MTKSNVYAKPFLKWAGGKRQLLDALNYYYPEQLKSGKIDYYYEPFVGGGAVYFDIIQKYPIKTAYIYDINEELILTYQTIQSAVDDLINELREIEEQYLPLTPEARNDLYYKVRDCYNQSKAVMHHYSHEERITRAAQTIFLNKTCFNGLYRVNRKGQFNVPAGKYKNPSILNKDNLLRTATLLKNTVIQVGDFESIRDDIKSSSAFVYYDPPYRPISKSANFTSYTQSPFDDNEQRRLAELFKDLDNLDIKQLLSNSDPRNQDPDDTFFDELYKDFNIYRVMAKRIINSNASKRGSIKELIITNYY